VVNDRGFDGGDFSTPERQVPAGRRFGRRTEACQSLGREAWGYRRDEDYYGAKYLMQSVQKTLAMGGNYLLNVGPDADGHIPEAQVALLRRIAHWWEKVRDGLCGAEPASDLVESEDILLTRRGDAVYVHLFRDPESSAVSLKPLSIAPVRATLVNTGEPVEVRAELTPRSWQEQWSTGVREHRGEKPAEYLRLRGLPVDSVTDEPMVVKLEFEAGALPVRSAL
jgi:alpha-L-fucosidase